MGRELRRVPLDFDWPINKTWAGFLNPLHAATPCEPCGGSGFAPYARAKYQQWYGQIGFSPKNNGSTPFLSTDPVIVARAQRNFERSPEYYGFRGQALSREARRLAGLFNARWSHHLNDMDVAALIAGDRLWDFTCVLVPGKGWQDRPDPYTPTAREVNDWSINGFGHDSINCMICVRAACARVGKPVRCSACDGEGEIWVSPEAKAAYEAWEPSDPPAGPAYQIWETVSEGSPISPPFATPEQLAQHMAGTKWGADDGTPYETWLAFINGPGWAPTMVVTGGVVMSGVEAAVSQEAIF